MATAKAIKKKLKTTKNIHKITKTMELVATAKLKSANNRFRNFQRYRELAQSMLTRVMGAGVEHPLLEKKSQVRHVTLLAISSNKGLCGSYNVRLIDEVRRFLQEASAEKKPVDLWTAGRKGCQIMKFKGLAIGRDLSQIPDEPGREHIDELASGFFRAFQGGETDEVWVLYTHRMKLRRQLLLPFTVPEAKKDLGEQYLWPDRASVLAELLPLCARNALQEMFLQAAVSEQTSRMLAMKMATENAEEMIKKLTRKYNRARQSQITKEILEIMAGANALQ